MILIIKCGGLPSFRTVAIWAGLIVANAASASAKAGAAAATAYTHEQNVHSG